MKLFGVNIIFPDIAPVSLLGGGFVVFAPSFLFAYLGKKHIDAHKKAKKIFETEMPMWEESVRRWEHLYYCERDDAIYIPNEGSVHISKIMEYLRWYPHPTTSFWDKLYARNL